MFSDCLSQLVAWKWPQCDESSPYAGSQYLESGLALALEPVAGGVVNRSRGGQGMDYSGTMTVAPPNKGHKHYFNYLHKMVIKT